MKTTTLIVGANSNIGSFISKKLAEENHNLLLMIHNDDSRIRDLKTKYPTKIFIEKIDLESESSVGNGIEKILDKSGFSLNNVLNLSSLRSSDSKKLQETNSEFWEKIIKVNLFGTYYVLKKTIPYLRKSNGKILLFSSNVTRIGLPNGSAYSASKAAISNLVRTLAQEEPKILINAISPGPVQIDNSHFSKEYIEFRKQYYSEKLKSIPLKRLASLEDVFGLVKFLISNENKYITGEEFFLTGGSL
jgi:NAD(P)-dependent dehydrogenase (short-subunit alcohol dehydrogenase family)